MRQRRVGPGEVRAVGWERGRGRAGTDDQLDVIGVISGDVEADVDLLVVSDVVREGQPPTKALPRWLRRTGTLMLVWVRRGEFPSGEKGGRGLRRAIGRK